MDTTVDSGIRARVTSLLRPTTAAVAVSLALAAVAGVLLAHDLALGLAFLVALVFTPLAFAHPPVALAAAVVAAFLAGVPGIGSAANRSLLVLALVLGAALLYARTGAARALAARGRELMLVFALLLWVGFTLLWAPEPSVGHEPLLHLGFSALVYVAVLSLVTAPQHARLLATAYVLGTVLSIAAGAVEGGLAPSGASLDSATSVEGRLQGGTGDPNYLAAAIVPAVILAVGLMARPREPLVKFALIGSIGILAAGLAATGSRGGLLAIGVVMLGALAIARGRRLRIATLMLGFAATAAAWFAANPAGWERVTSLEDAGSGRGDIWAVAWRAVEDHPIVGAGMSQFPVVSPDYLREPGVLSRADLLVDQRIVVHNVFLELWAETGLIGLLLFIAVAIAGVATAWTAAGRFDALGERAMATLSRAVLLAIVGTLTASFFLSNVTDRRVWVLLAFGPALLGIAERLAGAPRLREDIDLPERT